ncbi:Dual specificity phosphatase [Macleaya cordata]|uniref:Dual specificity phosphatase n=1 Tax=Macleaya cordata TaxID=56857 RepID=A0A200QGL6_MACCD|nr:Dual specificity phosphatase [Macleaya cordata]
MSHHEKEKPSIIITRTHHHHHQDINLLQERGDQEDKDLNLAVGSRVLYLLGDITAGPAYRFAQWLDSVRKRSGQYRSSGFPNRPPKLETMLLSAGEPIAESKSLQHLEQVSEISLWDRLGRATMLDIESTDFSWDMLSSLHRTEHNSSTEHSEDEMNKALEVTVNSGGVVFFALFNGPVNDESFQQEAAAVIKISSSRMATQSERLGYEFAKWLGVRTPQARVVHNSSPEWQQIKQAAEKARDAAILVGDDAGEMTCSELLEALELSRCLFLMNYVHGSPLLESSSAFDSLEASEKTAAALGRILMLDLVIRNEDRLPCRQLRWRGNSANLLFSSKALSEDMDVLDEDFGPGVIGTLQKERRASSVDGRLSVCDPELISQSSDISSLMSPKSTDWNLKDQGLNELKYGDFDIVAIDSGVPRRPPAGKRANDHAHYPKLVELLLNSAEYSSSLLYDITGGKVGCPLPEEADEQTDLCLLDITAVVREFRSGFRAALKDLQGFYIFLLTLYQKLDSLLRMFLTIIDKNSSGDFDKEDSVVSEPPSHAAATGFNCVSPVTKERVFTEAHADLGDMEFQRTHPRPSPPGHKESPDSVSPISRENWHGRYHKGSGDPLRSLRLTAKLRDFNKYAKVDAELHRELEQWNELLRTDAIKLCQDNNFNTGFFEGSENNSVVDAYELKVRLEHILERIALISEAASTEKPSFITGNLFIGGALAAKAVYTLQHLGITHILCLCSNEIGQSDSQYPDLFEYKNFSIFDNEDTKISNIFEEASDFIERVEHSGGKVLVHCFEGKSRSATVVLAYLMLRKNFTLLEAWNTLKRAHRRAQPNDGFAKILLDLDKKLHGKVSMAWQQKRPRMKVCPVCGKNAGLSSSSLKLHLQKSHRMISSASVDSAMKSHRVLSSGSVDSAMTMEIHKVLDTIKLSRGGSASPTEKQSQSMLDGLLDLDQ